ncbi:MAG: NADH-quinone oxidoreductase subunit NuoF, partial [Chloroflexota bacterium]
PFTRQPSGFCASKAVLMFAAPEDIQPDPAQKPDGCRVKGVGCMGLCGAGPMVAIDDNAILYRHVTVDDVPRVLAHLDSDAPPADIHCPQDTPFFTQQMHIVREYAGRIDPDHIEDYVAVGGYQALHRVLTQFTQDEVVDEITASGLRGRGGAGYPTGLKWSTVAKMPDGQKYVICNGDEGDPGAFMDRSIMEAVPHTILEGLAIAGYAVGASQAYIYVRAEYPLAIDRLKTAIKQARKHDLIGKHIFGTDFEFNVDIRLGAGAFVCGEETALMASIEGKRGSPRPRPPYPAASGLWGQPTLINNVETFANIVPIIREGADWFASIGTEHSKGTKIFALSGKVNNIGLIEVPMGMSLEEIVMEIGGGIPDGKAFKAVQTGGPSGGCIPTNALQTSVDYESLRALGSIMGSGGMIVMDETSSMVEVARYFMEFCMTESCGKCIPCRVGTAQMYDLLTKISAGEATQRDIDQLERLCDMVQATSLCGLGQSAPNPVISTLRYFRDEYLALLREPVMGG